MKKLLISLIVVATVLSTTKLQSLTVLQLNLEQMTALSEKVFAGKCVGVQERKDKAGRPVQYVTFKVLEMLKGEPVSQVTFKQLGYKAPPLDRDTAVQGFFREMPTYSEGEEAVLFLSAEGKLGFTAPIGIYQGKFDVVNQQGQKMVVNGAGNAGLFMGIKKSPRFKSLSLTSSEKNLLNTSAQEIPYENFISMVKKIAASE